MKLDSSYSWFMACSCSLVVFCTLGFFRTSGVFYLELQEVFQVSRETAVWPIGIAGFLLSLCASLPGFLNSFFSLRQILFTGITLISSGLSLCFFANSPELFTAFYGIIFAVGCGFSVPTSSILMNGHFNKYRGMANSILMSGDSLALFLLAPLTSYLLTQYELRGACLIIGGIFTNLYVLFMFMRTFEGTKSVKPKEEHSKLLSKSTKPETDVNSDVTFKIKLNLTLRNYWSVFKDPMYQICTTSQVFYSVIVVIYCIVIADYGIDCGMTKSDAVYLITVTGAAELTGRFTVGYIIDKKLLRPKTISCANEILISFILILQTMFCHSTILQFILCFAFGLLSGAVYSLGNVIYVQYLGVEKLGIALSLKSFLIAILAFLRPILIALCREKFGSYVYLFYILAILAFLFGLSWAFEPIIMKSRLRAKEAIIIENERNHLREAKV